MKTAFLILIFATVCLAVSAQYEKEMEYLPHYTAGLSQINSGSGHQAGFSVNMLIQKGRKSIGMGVVLQDKEGILCGADLRYRIFTGSYDESLFASKRTKPYLQYNLLYRKAYVDNPTVIVLNDSKLEIPDEPGTISTIEHYISFGVQLKLYKNIYLDSSLGLGVYIGSLDKINRPKTIGIHRENHGFTGIFNAGIGYRIN